MLFKQPSRRLHCGSMTYDDFKSLCESRRSIRYFDDKPISKEEIHKLLELARLAPSVENLQPWHFHVILNKDLCHALMKASYYGNFVEGAGIFIVITSDRTVANAAREPVWNEKELEYSCMAAAEHMLLGATAMGIGSCWISLARGNVHEVLKLPPHEVIVGGLMLGHDKRGEGQELNSRQRKPLEDIFSFHE